MSERRACRVIDADRKSVRYRSTRDDDAGLREKLRELANQRRRFGYRRLHILLRREGIMINRKKTQRLYKEEGLAVRRRRSRRRAVGTRAPAPVLALPNQRWSLDFVHDQMASGRRFRVLNVVDDAHLPFRRRERAMQRFRKMKSLQKFASVHASISNHFNSERHLIDRQTYKERRSAALAEWQNLAA